MPKIVFAKSGVSIPCEEGGYLLDLCEARESPIKFSCRARMRLITISSTQPSAPGRLPNATD